MKYVNNIDEYQSSSNNDLIRRISGINERFGTPKILKPMFDKVFQLIDKMISNNLNKDKIHLNGSYTSPDGKIFEFDKCIPDKFLLSNYFLKITYFVIFILNKIKYFL